MKLRIWLMVIAAACLGMVCVGAATMEQVLAPDFSPAGQKLWQLTPTAHWSSDNTLVCEVPASLENKNNKSIMKIDLKDFTGRLLLFTVEAKADNVSKPRNKWNGVKFMLYYVSPTTGKQWTHPSELYGSFGWKELSFAANIPEGAKDASLQLGLEESSGKVEFRKIRVYAFSKPDSSLKCEYSDAVKNAPTLRGTMSPSTYKKGDLKALAGMGANLIRWQVCRNWGKSNTDRDLEEYDRWINFKLNEFEQVLAEASEVGLKVIFDLHSPPGGRRPSDQNKDMEMFYNKAYSDWFVNFWRNFARRFKDHPAIWGYDLINEPMQSRPTQTGYWELQFEAAKAIRAIDPERPIIVESNNWCSPQAFNYLAPMPLKNVIYQVHVYTPLAYTHQLVHDDWKKLKNPKFISYPGPMFGTQFNKESLRGVLEPVRNFQLRHGARIYVGEFSAVRWAPGADRYLADCISYFEEYGWDWSYHAFREWSGWSVEHSDDPYDMALSKTDTRRKQVLLEAFKKNQSVR